MLGQEGRRSAHASTRAKMRLGVRQNTGPFPPAACVRCTAGTPLLWLVCRNRIHYLDSGEAAGINAQAAITISMPPPSLSVLSYNLLACGRYTQMLMLFSSPQIGPKLPNEGEGAYYSTSCIKRRVSEWIFVGLCISCWMLPSFFKCYDFLVSGTDFVSFGDKFVISPIFKAALHHFTFISVQR